MPRWVTPDAHECGHQLKQSLTVRNCYRDRSTTRRLCRHRSIRSPRHRCRKQKSQPDGYDHQANESTRSMAKSISRCFSQAWRVLQTCSCQIASSLQQEMEVSAQFNIT